MPRKKSNKNYWNELHEDAVVKYLSLDPTNDLELEERNGIFNSILDKPLRKMVSSIIRRYQRYIGNCGIEVLEEEAFLAIFENMDKFSPERNKKAYSYYGTICRNYVKTHSVKTHKLESRNDNFDILQDEFDTDLKYSYNIDEAPKDFHYEDILKELIKVLKTEISSNTQLKINDIKVAEGLISILENWPYLYQEYDKKVTTFFLKKKVYQLLKDITGLETKDIKSSIKNFKSTYFSLFLGDEE